MATILAVVSPRAQLQVKTQTTSPRMQQSAKTGTPQRTLRPANAPPEGGKVKRQLAMNLNKGGPVVNNRRNARERNRVKQVNQGFAVLRAHLPMAQKSKKISKVDTLRGAIDYIHGLTELLSVSECSSGHGSSSEGLAPPSFDIAADPAHGAAAGPETGYPGSAFLAPGYTAAATFPTEHGSYVSYGGVPSGEEPPSYGETVRQRRLARQLHQHQQEQQRSPQEDLINALRWWHPPAPRQ